MTQMFAQVNFLKNTSETSHPLARKSSQLFPGRIAVRNIAFLVGEIPFLFLQCHTVEWNTVGLGNSSSVEYTLIILYSNFPFYFLTKMIR